MRAGGALLLLLLAAGCLESGEVACADGRICPAGTICSDANRRCVTRDQIEACAGLDELATCEVAGAGTGVCRAGACLFSICGDGVVEGNETCDGANLGEATDCADLGYYLSQPLACQPGCQLDEEVCTGGRCGDGARNGPELCDGAAPDVQCIHIGFDVGALPTCGTRCEPDTSLCHRIGIDRLPLAAVHPPQDLVGTGPDDLYTIARGATVSFGRLFHHDGTAWLPVFDEVSSVWPIARGDVYATVRQGAAISLQHFDGDAWSVVEGVTPFPDQRVRASGPDDIHLLGSSQGVASLHWDGTRWREIDGLPEGRALDVWSYGPATAWAVIEQQPFNTLVRLDGASWVAVDAELEIVDAVWGTGADDVWVGGGRYLSHWDGDGWTLTEVPIRDLASIRSISGAAADGLYVVATERLGIESEVIEIGYLLHFDGEDWTAIIRLPGMRDVWTASATAVFLTGNPGTTYRYHGAVWQQKLLELSPGWFAVGFAARGDELFAAVNFSALVDNGYVYYFDTVGWQTPELVSSEALRGVFTTGPAIYAVGDAGLFRRIPDGSGWNHLDVDPGLEPELNAGWGDGDGARFAAGTALVHDIGGGWVVSRPAADCPLSLNAMWGTSANDVFAVGTCGTIFHFDGEGWTAMDSKTTVDLQAVWGRASDDVYAVGPGGAIIHFDGDGWSPVSGLPLAVDLNGISGTAHELFAIGVQGFVFHHDGTSWSQLEPGGVLDAMLGVGGRDHRLDFMSVLGADVTFLHLVRSVEWRAR